MLKDCMSVWERLQKFRVDKVFYRVVAGKIKAAVESQVSAAGDEMIHQIISRIGIFGLHRIMPREDFAVDFILISAVERPKSAARSLIDCTLFRSGAWLFGCHRCAAQFLTKERRLIFRR